MLQVIIFAAGVFWCGVRVQVVGFGVRPRERPYEGAWHASVYKDTA